MILVGPRVSKIGGVAYISYKYITNKRRNDLDNELIPLTILAPKSKSKKKIIKLPIWLLALFQNRKFLKKIISYLKPGDPNDPDKKLIDSILKELDEKTRSNQF